MSSPRAGDLGGHQGGDLSALEHVEGFDPRGLALVAVNRRAA